MNTKTFRVFCLLTFTAVVFACSTATPVEQHPTAGRATPDQSTPMDPPPNLEPNGTKSWQPSNPGGGGAFNSPVIGPTGIWAIGSDLGGLYVSSNQGQSWRAVGASSGLTATHIAALAANPRDGRLVIGTDDGVFTSAPDGTAVKRTLAVNGAYVSGIAFAANPSIVYAVVHPAWNALSASMYRSNNGGVSWTRTGALPASVRVLNLRTHPVDTNAVIAIVGEGRFNTGPAQAWLSNNAGASWQRIDPDAGPVLDVVYGQDPDNLNRTYLSLLNPDSGNGSLWRSEEAGWNWVKLVERSGVILTDAAKPGRVRLLNPYKWKPWEADAGVWESLDRGQTWRQLGHPTGWKFGWSKAYQDWGGGWSYQGLVQTFTSSRGGSNILWVDTQFAHASSDGGISFKPVMTGEVTAGRWRSHGLDNAVPAVIAPSAANANLVYAGYLDMGLWRSDDAGQSWLPLNEKRFTGSWLGHGGNTISVLPDPTRSEVVWAQLGGSLNEAQTVARSDKRGTPGTWRVVSGVPVNAKRIGGLSLDPQSSSLKRTVFVTADNTVYRSVDDGNSFGKVFSCACTQTWVLNAAVFAGGGGGLWRSLRNGEPGSWVRVNLPITNWTPALNWLDGDYVGLNDLSGAGNTSGLWAAVRGQGFYRSDDNGTSWTVVRTDHHARTVAYDPQTRQVMTGSSSAFSFGGYSSDSLGAMSSSDTGKTWQANNLGLAFPFVTQLRMGVGGVNWALSPGQGVVVQR
jgi:hypothetical protein